jgi:hypothetical protein
MMMFALGRTLTLQDQPELRRIMGEWGKRNYGMRELMQLVAVSEAMRNF